MKVQLLVLFVAACKAKEIPQDNFGDYQLFEERISDIVFANPLDYDLMMNKKGAIPCYQKFKGIFESYADKYQKDIKSSQRYYMDIDLKYRSHAKNILKTFEDLSKDLVQCDSMIWERLMKYGNMDGYHTIINCKSKISKYYDNYETELKLITDRINRNRIETKMRNFMEDVQNKFKRSTKEYVSCVAATP